MKKKKVWHIYILNLPQNEIKQKIEGYTQMMFLSAPIKKYGGNVKKGMSGKLLLPIEPKVPIARTVLVRK